MRKPIDKEELKEKLKELSPKEIADLLWDMWKNESKNQKNYWYFEFQKKRAFQVWIELNQVYN